MDAIKCQQCGGNVPVGFGIDGFECPYCGAVDSVEEQVRERIRKFYKGMRRFNDRSKQMPQLLRERFEQSVGRSGSGNWINLYFLGLFAFFWFITIRQHWGRWPDSTSGFADLVYIYMPMILPVFVLPWFLFAVWRRRHVTSFFEARTPLQPGGPARCRLCGGDLEDSGIVRRCSYCRTDSIVSKKLFGKYQDDLADAMEQMESDLEKRLAKIITKLRSLYMLTPLVYQIVLLILLLASGGLAFLLREKTAAASYRNHEYLYNSIGYLLGIGIVGFFLFKKWKEIRKFDDEKGNSQT